MDKRLLTKEQESILRQCLWDLNLTPDEFLDIIEGRSDRTWPNRAFCVARMLESMNWYDIVKVVEPERLCTLWDAAKRYVRVKSIKEGMDFACRILH